MASVAGSPVRPHSVSPKCTSLAVAMVASSSPGGCTSVRTRAGSQRSAGAPSTASVVLGVGGEPGRPARRGTARWSPPRRRRHACARRRPGSRRERHHDLVGAHAHELRVRGPRPRHRQARLRRPMRPDSRHGPRCRPDAVGPQAARRAPIRAACRRRRRRSDRRRARRADGGEDRGDLLGRRVRAITERRRAAMPTSGTLPCLRDGSCSRLVRSIASDRTSTRRVSRGSMTSST